MNRRIGSHGVVLRFYFLVVIGLIGVAAALDYVLAGATAEDEDWMDSLFALVERDLAATPEADWTALVAGYQRELGLRVEVTPEQLVASAEPLPRKAQRADDDGRTIYFRRAHDLPVIVQLSVAADPRPAARLAGDWIPPLFYLAILVLTGLWLRPLVRDINLLSESAREFAADYHDPLPRLRRATALAELAASFNAMASRIRSLIVGQKDLTNAISHEIRTPLARIRFTTAMLADRPELAEQLRSIDRDIDEVDRLVESMLDYARLEHGDQVLEWETVPAADWLAAITARFAEGPDAQSASVQVASTSRVDEVVLDPRLMELALSNLLANACRHARSQVAVCAEATSRMPGAAGAAAPRRPVTLVRWLRRPKDDADAAPANTHPTVASYRLTVDDDGDGIPAADRERVFLPFTRLADQRHDDGSGYGLGLAIVARVAGLHGGSAEAAPSPLGGARFVISWRHPAGAAS